MDKSPKPVGRHEGRSPLKPREGDDGGRGTPEDAKTSPTIVPDLKGGTGERGDDDDDRKHHRPHSPRAT